MVGEKTCEAGGIYRFWIFFGEEVDGSYDDGPDCMVEGSTAGVGHSHTTVQDPVHESVQLSSDTPVHQTSRSNVNPPQFKSLALPVMKMVECHGSVRGAKLRPECVWIDGNCSRSTLRVCAVLDQLRWWATG